MESRKDAPATPESKTIDSRTSLPIDSSQLRAFEILARTKSFTETAAVLHLTQSAVSRAMQALEEDLGCRLFNRKEKPISLTPVGEQLLARAGKILREMTAARSELSKLHERVLNHLRIGVDPVVCLYFLPALLPRFAMRFPEVKVSIEPRGLAEATEALRADKVDLAFCLQPKALESLDFLPVYTDELLLLVNPSHPWAKSGRVEPAELSRQTFIFHRATAHNINEIVRQFCAMDAEVPGFCDCEDVGALKQLVQLGTAATILPRWTVRQELAGHSLVPIPFGKRKLRQTWGILSSRGKLLSPVEKGLVELCKAVASACAT